MGNGWPRSTHRGTCAHKAQARVWPELHCIQRISAFPRPSFQVSGLRKSERYLAWPLPNVLWEKAASTFGRFASSPVFMPRACPLTHNLGVVSCTYRMVRRKHIVFNTRSTLSVVNQAMRRVEGNVLDSKSVSIRQASRADFELRGPYGILQILIFRFEK